MAEVLMTVEQEEQLKSLLILTKELQEAQKRRDDRYSELMEQYKKLNSQHIELLRFTETLVEKLEATAGNSSSGNSSTPSQKPVCDYYHIIFA